MPTEFAPIDIHEARSSQDVEDVGRFLYCEFRIRKRWEIGDADEQRGRLPIPSGSHTLAAWLDGEVIGTLRATLIDPTQPSTGLLEHYGVDRFFTRCPDLRAVLIEKFAIAPEHRRHAVTRRADREGQRPGPTVGQLLFARAYRLVAQDLEAELVFFDCTSHALGMYYALGARKIGRVVRFPGRPGVVVPLGLALRDLDRFRKCGSPLAAIATRAHIPSSTVGRDLIEEVVPRMTRGDDRGVQDASMLMEAMVGLEDTEVFRDIPADELEELTPDLVPLRHGEMLLDPSHESQDLYILLDGFLDVRHPSAPETEILATLIEGEVVGDMAWLARLKPSASVVSCGRSSVLKIDGERLRRFVEDNDRAGKIFYKNLARIAHERLRRANYSVHREVDL